MLPHIEGFQVGGSQGSDKKVVREGNNVVIIMGTIIVGWVV